MAKTLKTASSVQTVPGATRSQNWPGLAWPEWRETQDTLHMWTQIIGKIRMALAPRTNHWWHTTLYPSCHGLTTSPMPYGQRTLEIEFDFLDHQLRFHVDDGRQESFPLRPMTVADFYAQVMAQLEQLGMPVAIRPWPIEVADGIPFASDTRHAAYDAEAVTRFWRILMLSTRVMNRFRGRFLGKVSPVHFFWGGFDLAVTRFSGRMAPPHPSVPYMPDSVVRAAYSHEVSSCGFWPGGPMLPEPIFYSYAYPAPEGFADAPVRPLEAYFNRDLGEFILPYEAVRQSTDPDGHLLAFLQSTYEAAARLGQWSRSMLEAVGNDF